MLTDSDRLANISVAKIGDPGDETPQRWAPGSRATLLTRKYRWRVPGDRIVHEKLER